MKEEEKEEEAEEEEEEERSRKRGLKNIYYCHSAINREKEFVSIEFISTLKIAACE